MQSLTRQLKRGNAIIIFDNVFKRLEQMSKRGTESKLWRLSQKFRSEEAEKNHTLAPSTTVVGKVGRKKEWVSPTRKRPYDVANHKVVVL